VREAADVKARRYLVEARVRVRQADEDDGAVMAEVRGDSGRIYAAGHDLERGWWCDCPAIGPRCSHLRALQLVTVMEPRS
jgi:hypothetical protein